MVKNLLTALIRKLSVESGLNNQRADMETDDYEFTDDGPGNCERVLAAVQHSTDCIMEQIGAGHTKFQLVFFKSLVDIQALRRDLVRPVQQYALQGLPWEKVIAGIAIGHRKKATKLKEAVSLLLDGYTLISLPQIQGFYAFKSEQIKGRGIEKAENQSIVIGPQDAFTESLVTNLSQIRRRLKSPFLRVESLKIGDMTQTGVAILSVEGIVNEGYLQEIHKRLEQVDVDGLLSSGELVQMIDDQPLSPFPQFNQVERPDAVVANLMDGKICVMVDGTPYAFIGPSSFIEFFHSPEDYFNRWLSTSLMRLLRLFGVIVSITFSAIYVAVLTYHYEIIPATMLKTIALSRAKVPFPPLYEALLLELILEVLREAGERLPTKVGQTMGIVGGIVIGQAAVSAGLTSNVMIIVVSLSALASFVTPSYAMGNAVRVIRFPIILLSGLLGFIGLMVGLVTILIHLLNLSSLGAPYLSPWAPLRLSDLKDSVIRVPTQLLMYRPSLAKTKRDRMKGNHSLRRK